MVFLGVPIFDWLVLAVALGLGVEAWITCRPSRAERKDSEQEPGSR